MLEQYLAASNAFLANMRGRFDARLALLRRGEQVANGNREEAPGNAEFWLAFSRLTAALRRVTRCAEVSRTAHGCGLPSIAAGWVDVSNQIRPTSPGSQCRIIRARNSGRPA
jgi:hypothetical protein